MPHLTLIVSEEDLPELEPLNALPEDIPNPHAIATLMVEFERSPELASVRIARAEWFDGLYDLVGDSVPDEQAIARYATGKTRDEVNFVAAFWRFVIRRRS